jgi:N-hydroxyarylamine O-acetyltransferase
MEHKKEAIKDPEILEEYLQFIGYSGERKPTLAVLQELQKLHTQTITFENLNPLLKYGVDLEIEAISRKILRQGRGGYCFEQNALFAHVLQLLGFHIKRLAARVLWNLPIGLVVARGHKLLLVDVENEGPYVVDVGFGGLSLTGPLKLEMNIPQQTPHEVFRIIEGGEQYIIQVNLQDQWKPLYTFSLQEQQPQDYDAPNFYISCHPKSHFTYTLIAAKPVPGKRYNLRNNELTIHHLNGPSEKKLIKDVKELKSILTDIFKINLEGLKGLDEKLEEIVKG